MLYECWTVDTDIFLKSNLVDLRLCMNTSESKPTRKKCLAPLGNDEGVYWIDIFPDPWSAIKFIYEQYKGWLELGFVVNFKHDIDHIKVMKYPDEWFKEAARYPLAFNYISDKFTTLSAEDLLDDWGFDW